MSVHIPVLLNEVIKYLNPQPNQNFIDCTVGGGGHTAAILEKIGPNGKVLGIEVDYELYKKLLAAELKNRLVLVNGSYINLIKIIKKYNFYPIHGILFDLGLSSWHLKESGRGFSFQKNEILDMRYDIKHQILTAMSIINGWSAKEIEKILKEYGEEKFAKRISGEITKARKIKPIKTTFELVEIIKRATPFWYHRQRIHFATRTFQALRIAVNGELENLKKALIQAINVLIKGGRIVVISYHSLEDRIVKNYLKGEKRLKVLFRKPLKPSLNEILINPRSRSAKLRTAEKIAN